MDDATRYGNGQTAEELFDGPTGRTFDDFNVIPSFSAEIERRDVELQSRIGGSPGIALKLPVVSSPMDTVTEHDMAIAMALHGGLGIIHFNNKPREAVLEVERVKRSQMGIVREPICCRPDDPVGRVKGIQDEHGFSTVLITKDGTPDTKLLGMVTKGHTAFAANRYEPLKNVMIPRDQLVVGSVDSVCTSNDAFDFLRDHPAAHKLPLLRKDGSVGGFVTRKDVVKRQRFPNALLNRSTGQLTVGAAVSTHLSDRERINALLDAGVDLIVVDSAQGGTEWARQQIEYIRTRDSDVMIMAGNVVTPAQAEPLIRFGANILRIGMGSGSICTTQEVMGVGRAQCSAVYHVAAFCRTYFPDVAVVSDGGVRNQGDILKALACGAHAVMVGRFIAGCEEAPGPVLDVDGRQYKRYRGMGSMGAMQSRGGYRYGTSDMLQDIVPQGVEGLVPAQGSVGEVMKRVASGLRTAFEYLGCDSIPVLHDRVQTGEVRFELRSLAAVQEGAVHDIQRA